MIPVTYKSEMEGYIMPRGGKRPCAGRPPGNPEEAYCKLSVSISPLALAAIDEFAAVNRLSQSAAIEKLALVGLKKP
jgi:hypothetical protein